MHLQAQEEFTFAGIGMTAQTIRFEETSRSDENVNTVALKLGKQTRRARTTFELDYTNDYLAAALLIDYIPFDTMFGTPKLRPYIGINTQYLRYEDDSIDEDGFGAGFQTGLIFYASESIDVDMGYRYTFITNSDELDTAYGFTVSLHYFFE
jgi:opacity protein-like surface antigen